jgi:hypothetical protein
MDRSHAKYSLDCALFVAMGYFVIFVEEAGAPVTYIEYEDGEHGFDSQQKTPESAEIIARTLQYMKENFNSR